MKRLTALHHRIFLSQARGSGDKPDLSLLAAMAMEKIRFVRTMHAADAPLHDGGRAHKKIACPHIACPLCGIITPVPLLLRQKNHHAHSVRTMHAADAPQHDGGRAHKKIACPHIACPLCGIITPVPLLLHQKNHHAHSQPNHRGGYREWGHFPNPIAAIAASLVSGPSACIANTNTQEVFETTHLQRKAGLACSCTVPKPVLGMPLDEHSMRGTSSTIRSCTGVQGI